MFFNWVLEAHLTNVGTFLQYCGNVFKTVVPSLKFFLRVNYFLFWTVNDFGMTLELYLKSNHIRNIL